MADNLAVALSRSGSVQDAEPISIRAMTSARRVLGEDHPDTLMCMSNYASIVRSLGRAAEAEPLQRDILEKRRRRLGSSHFDTTMSMNNHASALYSLGRFDEAEKLYREALDRRRQVLGELHSGTIWSMHNYVAALLSVQQFSEAETLIRRVLHLSLRSRELGGTHPETIKYARTLTRILLANNKPDEARTVAAEFGLPDPTTQPATTRPTTQPLDDARVAEIRAFVAKLEAEWAGADRAAGVSGATQPATRPN